MSEQGLTVADVDLVGRQLSHDQMNVIMVGPMTVQGGITSVVNEYVKGGLQQRVSLTTISMLRDGPLRLKLWVFAKALFPYWRAVTRTEDPLIHIHVSQDGSFARKLILFTLARLARRRTLVHLHGSQFEAFMHRHWIITRLVRYVFDNATAVAVLSNVWRHKIAAFSKNPTIFTLYNPMAVAPTRSGSADGSTTVLFLGKLGTRKGTYDILASLEAAHQTYRDKGVRFVLAGNGDVDEVRKIVSDNGWEDLVEVPGWVSGDDKKRHLENCDILILPSYNEQMPMSVLEGMSYGYPIVSTTVAGIPEMVEHERNGILFEPGDVESFTAAVLRLADDGELRTRMGRESQALVDEKFETQVILDQLMEVYRILQADTGPT